MISRTQNRSSLSKLTYQKPDDDEEEAARERRRRARQERQRLQRDDDTDGHGTEKSESNAQNSISTDEIKTTTITNSEQDEEAALLERLAKREERRLKRLQEALDRQKELDHTIADSIAPPLTRNRREENEIEENESVLKDETSTSRRDQYEIEENETVTKSYQTNDWRQDQEEKEEKHENQEENQEEKTEKEIIEENQIKDDKSSKDKTPKEEGKPSWDRKKGFLDTKAQNGESFHDATPHKLKHTEFPSRTSLKKGHTEPEEVDGVPKVEAGKRLDELRRRRGETESEEFEKLKQKQQEATVELEELKKKREERKKILEEEERKKKQDEAERKAKEEEEKKRLKEEIEKRRAEAAEKRQKIPEDGLQEEKKPFKCVTPKGSLKEKKVPGPAGGDTIQEEKACMRMIEERAEFLSKSAQKSGVKPTQPAAVVSKIDSRLSQYTSAIEGTKAGKAGKPAASDLPLPAEGVRNIKSMWEKGSVYSSPGGPATPNKETAGLKFGVSSRISSWQTKTPEVSKSPPPKPTDLKPVDVSNKRNLWEKQSSTEKPGTPTKVTIGGKNKPDTNAGLRQFEKEP
ncbi:caldesmon isoform X2 [Pleurodeles waltl]|uniref:caldesmon isoform X2 n=1 Tax=Pleurodeles waltl TaxID=8319 RepID=UPI0037097533